MPRKYNGEWTSSSINSFCWENYKSTCRKMILDLYLTPYMKSNEK
jgi:hypothetical protein